MLLLRAAFLLLVASFMVSQVFGAGTKNKILLTSFASKSDALIEFKTDMGKADVVGFIVKSNIPVDPRNLVHSQLISKNGPTDPGSYTKLVAVTMARDEDYGSVRNLPPYGTPDKLLHTRPMETVTLNGVEYPVYRDDEFFASIKGWTFPKPFEFHSKGHVVYTLQATDTYHYTAL